MFKTSFITRAISLSVLITLLLASFPTAASAAKTNNRGLEAKWAKLVERYNRLAITHNSSQRWVQQWMSDNRRAPASKKAEIRTDLAKSNAAWAAATSIAIGHRGFDANGNVIDKAAAQQSIKDLAKALQRYTGSAKDLKRLIHQFNKEG